MYAIRQLATNAHKSFKTPHMEERIAVCLVLTIFQYIPTCIAQKKNMVKNICWRSY